MRQTVFMLLLSCILLFSGCAKGNISHAERILGESALYVQSEIEDAMDVAMAHFKAEFEGCTLLEMEYDENHSLRLSEDWAETYGAEEAIVLLSSFYVPEKGADGGLTPGQTYGNFQWVLVRSDGGAWELKTWGYG